MLGNILTFLAIFLIAIFHSPFARAEDLLGTYMLAIENDPSIRAAREAQLAAREAYPQARALFLPVISGSGSYIEYHKQYYSNVLQVSNLLIILNKTRFPYDQGVIALNVTQPIFYYQQWLALEKATAQVKQANATFAAAEQDLIARTILRYIAVLQAIDNLNFSEAQYKAFSKLYEQTDARFKAGITNTITDVQVAQARRDNAYSQVILAKNTVAVQKKFLEEITCVPVKNFLALRDDVHLTPPVPDNMQDWICIALDQNLILQAFGFLVEASREDVKLNNSGHLPTLSLNGSVIRSGPAKDIFPLPGNTNAYFGVQASIPIYSGGSVVSKTRQARHIYEQNFQQMEVEHRRVGSIASQAFLGILTQLAQIEALKQSVKSNTTALQAIAETLKAGTQYTIVDLLNAESDLIKSQQDLANARYTYILQSTQLKQTAGMLCPEDIEQINSWLK